MTFLERLCSALNQQKLDYALVGGHAVTLYGEVRGTVDVDFVVRWSHKSILKPEATLKTRMPIFPITCSLESTNLQAVIARLRSIKKPASSRHSD